MNDTPTPRTNYAQYGTGRVSVEFAKTLERELAAVTEQRDEAREDAATWKSLLSAMERAGAEQACRVDENKLTTAAVTEQRDEARRLAERYRNLSCDTLEKADETLLPWEITNQNA